MVLSRKFVGIVGTGAIGTDPFARRTWSFSSYYLFTALQRHGALERAFGVEAPKLAKIHFQLRNFRFDRRLWRDGFYLDTGYYRAVTKATEKAVRPSDYAHIFLQIGAFYDVPSFVGGRAPCVSYHDGNLAELARSPYGRKDAVLARRIDQALAWERQVYAGLNRIFTMSEYLRRSFIADFSVPPEKVVNIGGGMNIDAVPPHRPEKEYKRREILFIGVDFERKGGWELLKAFKAVRAKYPDAKLNIAGPRALKVPPDLSDGIEFHGFLDKTNPADKARLDELYGRSILFVMPSLYEPFGIAPLEAMAHQLPCVVTNRWAFPEFVVPGSTGDLVECGSVEHLAESLLRLLQEPERLKSFGDRARNFALDRYTWDGVTERMANGVRQLQL